MATQERLYPRFSDAEFARRRNAVSEMMERTGAQALVIFGSSTLGRTGQADVYYLSHHLGMQENYLVWVQGQEPTLLVQSFNHVPNGKRQSVLPDTRWGGPSSARTVVEVLREKGFAGGRLGLVGTVPYQTYLAIAEAFPSAAPADATRDYRLLRVTKSDEEMEWLRRGAELTDAALRSMVDGMHAGMREDELAMLLEQAYLPHGGQDHFYYISSTPQDASDRCVPAQNLSRRVLQPGDIVLNEISVAYWGYSGQIHRPIILDAEPNELYAELWDTSLEAYNRVCEAIRPGATVEDALEAAEVISQRGYTICDGLIHGFGVGLLPPSVRTRQTVEGEQRPFTFQAGMALVVQPNVITSDFQSGVQLGNLVLVTETGLESLQQFPIEFVRA